MLYELIRSIVQKVLQDKILMGLVIVGVLALFVGGLSLGDDKGKKAVKAVDSPEQQQSAQSPQLPQSASGGGGNVAPNLASDFVKWWLNGAMDYSQSTAQQSHNEAMAWMTPDAARSFQNSFWSPEIANAVTSGQLVAAFQPTGVQAEAINPDGSVVVGVAGTVIVQSNGQPSVQQFGADFLVRQDKDGLRVAGLYSKAAPLTGQPVY